MRAAALLFVLLSALGCDRGRGPVIIVARPLPGPGAPQGYEDGALAIDPVTGDVLYAGGLHSGIEELAYYGTTSRFTGDAWVEVNESLPPRYGHSVVFDEKRNTLVLFGGRGLCGEDDRRTCCNETWEWDGTEWRQVMVEGPGARAYASMVYDSVGERVLLFGGSRCDADDDEQMWAYDGLQWSVVQ